MPRQARLDAPGVLHQVMGRGIERRRLVPDDTDRADVMGRLAALGTATALTGYAWALFQTTPTGGSGRAAAPWAGACGRSARGTPARATAATSGGPPGPASRHVHRRGGGAFAAGASPLPARDPAPRRRGAGDRGARPRPGDRAPDPVTWRDRVSPHASHGKDLARLNELHALHGLNGSRPAASTAGDRRSARPP